MNRSFILGFALLLACSHGASSSGGTASSSPAAANAPQTTVVQPSELSPEQVRLLQRALTDRGFALDLSGQFDDRTQTALMDFQRARGLPTTGNLNRPTVEALGLDPREVTPVRGSSQDQGSSSEAGRAAGDTDRGAEPPAAQPGSAPPPAAPPSSPSR
jgi:peptidoglycan hydrolase-like protein with peptidoglycan-binding domain